MVERSEPTQHSDTPVSTKKEKTSEAWWCARLLSQLLGRLRQENCLNPESGGCSEPTSCRCTPAWAKQSETPSQQQQQQKEIHGSKDAFMKLVNSAAEM